LHQRRVTEGVPGGAAAPGRRAVAQLGRRERDQILDDALHLVPAGPVQRTVVLEALREQRRTARGGDERDPKVHAAILSRASAQVKGC